MSENEALWIKQALQGDDNAFGNLVNHYQRPVFSLCYRLLGNSKDAEDAAQECFIRAYTHLNKYDQDRSFATWLLSIAAHYCIDQIRKRQLPTFSIDALPGEIIADHNTPNPEEEFRSAEKEAMIQTLIQQLRPLDRAALVLRYWHEYSEIEIAEVLGLTVSAVKSRLYRSRQSLAEAYLAETQATLSKTRRPYESPAL